MEYLRRPSIPRSNMPGALIEKLDKNKTLTKEEFITLIRNYEAIDTHSLFELARKRREEVYGDQVFTRGLIEFTNYCKNDCYYCGIRLSNRNADRYRLTQDEILEAANKGYELGFRTVVLQGGEDPHYKDEDIAQIVSKIKINHPDIAVTLSVGERSKETYQKWFDAGTDRYLLRHETANEEHYKKLHPENLDLRNRINCLRELKEIGYQVGAGFMVGSPYQTPETLADDLLFINDLKPHMVGIGPFIPHKDTKFKDEEKGSLELTLFLLAVIRIMLPEVLLPATTALGTINPRGRELGLMAGANVVMPNLSPKQVREKYSLYDNKICTGEEAAECKGCLQRRIEFTGLRMVVDRGDHIHINKERENV